MAQDPVVVTYALEVAGAAWMAGRDLIVVETQTRLEDVRGALTLAGGPAAVTLFQYRVFYIFA